MAEAKRIVHMNEVYRDWIRRAYEAYSRGDLDAVAEFLDERVELYPPAASTDPEPRSGIDAVRAYMEPDSFEDQTAEPQEVLQQDNRILVVARVRARGRVSGVNLDDVSYHLWTMEGGRAVRFDVMLDREEAMARLKGG